LPIPAAVIFDLDGTLVDTVETRIRAWLATFDWVGIPATREQVAPLIGADGRFLARRVAADAGSELPEGRDEEIDREAGETYAMLNRAPRPLPGVRELLAELDRGAIRWAIATSSRRGQVQASVDALALAAQPSIVDGSSVEHAKPEPDLLLAAAKELGVEPERCWCVGDSTWDMQAATAAGMAAVAVTAGAAVSADELRKAGAQLVVPTLDALAEEIRAAAA
jgi:HAD superfamily hydrolase (TIGR01509 family)